MSLADQVKAKQDALRMERERIRSELPKFTKEGIEAFLTENGELELYADGIIPNDTKDKFVQWILNVFVRKEPQWGK